MQFHCISADSHLEVRPDRYTPRVPRRYRDHAPRVLTLHDGTLAVLVEGKPMERMISNISCGKPFEDRHPFDPLPGDNFETSPGTGPPEQRVQEQDADGVEAEILFPGNNGPSFWRGIQNDDAFKAVVRAYNDWLAEDYCSYNPDRLLGVGVIPMTNLDDAITELEHCANLGLKAVNLNAFPTGQRQPTSGDDKFYAAALDVQMPLTIHVQFGFPQRGPPPPPALSFKYPKTPNPEFAVPDVVAQRFNKYGFRGSIQATQLIWSGVFDRFPDLRLYIAEVQLGWIPMWMETLDFEYTRQRFWVERVLGLPQLSRMPSEYAREHFWWGFQSNPVGVRIAKAELGLGRSMWSSDFPHLESDWPHSQRVIEEFSRTITEEEKYQLVAGNAIEYFHLDGRTITAPNS